MPLDASCPASSSGADSPQSVASLPVPACPAPFAGKPVERKFHQSAVNPRRWWNALDGAGRKAVTKTEGRLRVGMKVAALRKEKAKASLLDTSAPVRRRVMTSFRDVLKEGLLADREIWSSVDVFVRQVVDQVWEDVEHEVERSLECALLKQRQDEDAEGPSLDRLLHSSCVCLLIGRLWCGFRAFVLHHFLPHNRSIFGKLRDPVYLLILFASLDPFHGVRVVLYFTVFLLLICPGPPDEFQLLHLIVIFKVTQFFTSGIIGMAVGSLQYFYCYVSSGEQLKHCIDVTGPGSYGSSGQAVDYLGSVVLGWVIFASLGRSRRHGIIFLGRESGQVCDEDDEVGGRLKGGRMRQLLRYDMACFVLSLAVLALLTVLSCGELEVKSLAKDPRFRQSLFWCRVLYSVCALPFTIFTPPVVLQVLTHSKATGYNENGACVAFDIPMKRRRKPAFSKIRGVLRGAQASIRSTAAAGREVRGGDTNGAVGVLTFPSDLGRGLWLKRSEAVESLKGAAKNLVTGARSLVRSGSKRISTSSRQQHGKELSGQPPWAQPSHMHAPAVQSAPTQPPRVDLSQPLLLNGVKADVESPVLTPQRTQGAISSDIASQSSSSKAPMPPEEDEAWLNDEVVTLWLSTEAALASHPDLLIAAAAALEPAELLARAQYRVKRQHPRPGTDAPPLSEEQQRKLFSQELYTLLQLELATAVGGDEALAEALARGGTSDSSLRTSSTEHVPENIRVPAQSDRDDRGDPSSSEGTFCAVA